MRNCDGCEVAVCCSQFRCRDFTNSKIHLYTVNDPIVESSSKLVFGPYNFKYPKLEEHAGLASLTGQYTDDEGVVQLRVNKWNLIYDFTINEDGDKNFELLT